MVMAEEQGTSISNLSSCTFEVMQVESFLSSDMGQYRYNLCMVARKWLCWYPPSVQIRTKHSIQVQSCQICLRLGTYEVS